MVDATTYLESPQGVGAADPHARRSGRRSPATRAAAATRGPAAITVMPIYLTGASVAQWWRPFGRAAELRWVFP